MLVTKDDDSDRKLNQLSVTLHHDKPSSTSIDCWLATLEIESVMNLERKPMAKPKPSKPRPTVEASDEPSVS